MLRFALFLLMFIFAGVMVVTVIYLIIVYNFNTSMWNFYFPR